MVVVDVVVVVCVVVGARVVEVVVELSGGRVDVDVEELVDVDVEEELVDVVSGMDDVVGVDDVVVVVVGKIIAA
jgi:hypothetical protein